MTKQLHSQEYAEATAGQSNAHKPCFRDAPGRFLGGSFIRKHKKETNRIDYNQVKNKA